jgi:large subunit ribosomal protein L21
VKNESSYAVVEIGGKQYKVAPGQAVEVDRLRVPQGQRLEFERVLLIKDGDEVTIGKPFIEGAKVVATSLGEIKGKKLIVFKYKAKTRYRRKKGHRQIYSKILVNEIMGAKKEA